MARTSAKQSYRQKIAAENDPPSLACSEAATKIEGLSGELYQTSLDFCHNPGLLAKVIKITVEHLGYSGDASGFSRDFTFGMLEKPQNIREFELNGHEDSFRNCVADRVDNLLAAAKGHNISEDVFYGSFVTAVENRMGVLESEHRISALEAGQYQRSH